MRDDHPQTVTPAGGSADRRHSVVVVVGSTGVGKSKLAIDLAARLGGEVVNADALQVYQGLDVTTNKVTAEEANGVPHHLLGFLDTSAEYTAKMFRDAAIPIIEDIVNRGRIPIICGGSNYYVQALVSPYLLDEHSDLAEDDERRDGKPTEAPQAPEQFKEYDPTSAPCVSEHVVGGKDSSGSCPHARLAEIDPVAAARLHPHDTRKAVRYLEIYIKTGKKPSEIFQAQTHGQLRYRCCWLWLDAEQALLDLHLEARVESMIKRGLVDEVVQILRSGAASDCGNNYTVGLKQAIGVKEFEEYAACVEHSGGTNRQPSGTGMESRVLQEACSAYVLNTSKLARRQRRRLAGFRERGGWPLYKLSATQVFRLMYERSSRRALGGAGALENGPPEDPTELWERTVTLQAVERVESFLAGIDCVADSQIAAAEKPDLWVQRTCEACGGRVLRGDNEWRSHVQGRNHKKRVAAQKKRLKQSEKNAARQ